MNFSKTPFICFILTLFSCQKDLPLNKCKEALDTKHDKAIILVLGQSNAANAGETTYYAACEKLSNFYNGELFPLKDPLKGANGLGGSVWSRMAEQLHQKSFAKEIIIAPAAVGGTKIQQWIPGGDLNPLIVTAIQSLQEQNLEITHVLWHQGESNNAMNIDVINPEANAIIYQESFLILVTQLRDLGVDAPVFIATATRCGWLEVDPVLQEAQQELANAGFGIYLGPNTDLLGNEYRYDDCHFSTEGLKIHASMWTEILLQH